MRKNTTLNTRSQTPDDLIDFPVSDVYRDHYASQGLTFSAGRYGRSAWSKRYKRNEYSDENQELDAARQEVQGWRSQTVYWEARCAKLEEEVQRLQNQTAGRRPDASRYMGVAVNAYT